MRHVRDFNMHINKRVLTCSWHHISALDKRHHATHGFWFNEMIWHCRNCWGTLREHELLISPQNNMQRQLHLAFLTEQQKRHDLHVPIQPTRLIPCWLLVKVRLDHQGAYGVKVFKQVLPLRSTNKYDASEAYLWYYHTVCMEIEHFLSDASSTANTRLSSDESKGRLASWD